jgi:hypothetical protein
VRTIARLLRRASHLPLPRRTGKAMPETLSPRLFFLNKSRFASRNLKQDAEWQTEHLDESKKPVFRIPSWPNPSKSNEILASEISALRRWLGFARGTFSCPEACPYIQQERRGKMQRYSFRVTRGRHLRQDISSDLPDNQAAKREAVAIFSDLARSFAHDLDVNPEWQIEVTDEFRKPIFRLTLLAESLQ